MEIIVRNENKKDYGRVEEITRKFYESDIYNDDLNRESVKKFDAEFNKTLIFD